MRPKPPADIAQAAKFGKIAISPQECHSSDQCQQEYGRVNDKEHRKSLQAATVAFVAADDAQRERDLTNQHLWMFQNKVSRDQPVNFTPRPIIMADPPTGQRRCG